MIEDRYDLTPRERVEGFVQAYSHYTNEKVLQPLPEERTFDLLATQNQTISLRIRPQRAAMIRKFVLSQKDAHHLLKIHKCLESQSGGSIDFESRARLSLSLEVLESGNVGPIGIIEI